MENERPAGSRDPQNPRPPRPHAVAGPQRPTSLTIVSILAWVFGGIGILYSPMGILSLYSPGPGGQANPMLKVFEAAPLLRTYTIAAMVLGVLAAGVLVLGGVGLWKLRRWGWTLCNAYAVWGIAAALVGTAVNMLYMVPALKEHVDASTPQGQGALIGGIIGGVCGSGFGFVIPVVLLIVINRGAAAAAKPPN